MKTKQPDTMYQPDTMCFVVGLGNPGEAYAATRHNAGFLVIDELARRFGVSYWKHRTGAEIAFCSIPNNSTNKDGKGAKATREIVLAKPQSYMNCSGGPVAKLLASLSISPQEMIVIHDDLDIAEGTVKIKFSGGHAGHNGLRSIIDKLGSRDFARVRVGIGRPPGRMQAADYVLAPLRDKNLGRLLETCVATADAVELCPTDGITRAR